MSMILAASLLALLSAAAGQEAVDAGAAPPHGLRVDRIQPERLPTASPLVMGASLRPILSWQLPDTAAAGAARAQEQQAYELVLWRRHSHTDNRTLELRTGRVESSDRELSLDALRAAALAHETEYEWQVRVWQSAQRLGHGNTIYALAVEETVSSWSAPHRFETLVSAGSWHARGAEWIGGGNQLRGGLTVPAGKTIKSARVRAPPTPPNAPPRRGGVG